MMLFIVYLCIVYFFWSIQFTVKRIHERLDRMEQSQKHTPYGSALTTIVSVPSRYKR